MDTRYAKYIQGGMAIGGILDFFIPFGWALWVPLVMWLFGPKSEFNSWHGREAVRWQLMLTLYQLVVFVFGVALSFGLAGFNMGAIEGKDGLEAVLAAAALSFPVMVALIVVIVIHIVGVVLPFVAMFKAMEGQYYVYPFVFSPRHHRQMPSLV